MSLVPLINGNHEANMKDLSTKYLGLDLKNPLVVGSCGLTYSVDKIKELAGQGAGAVVLKSLFEEQILEDRRLLEFPPSMQVPGQGWEYLGAGHSDTSPGNTIVLRSRKADRTQKVVVARSDGLVEVVRESELQ